MNIISLNSTLEEKYSEFLLRQKNSLIYSSIKYKKLLEDNLKCKSHYLLAVNKDNNILGSFPIMLKENGEYGNIANSLPFYGSYGGIILDQDLPANEQRNIKRMLLSAGEQYFNANNCAASTIITNPFETDQDWYKDNCDYDFIDHRIGQRVVLPKNNFEDTLFKSFHYKTRNMVRKAINHKISIDVDNSHKSIEFLYRTHKVNLSKIGGKAKQKHFFESIPEFLNEGDFKIFVADSDEGRMAALLLIYFNKTVEYFTPVIVEKFRKYQPLSLIIYKAMSDAIENGYNYWNWGGTWQTQDGIYRFKKRWGSKDYLYSYYTKIYDKSILNINKESLLSSYDSFYVVPFNHLNHHDK